ncbi:hypothetical protein V8F06_000989 [Rhypophila decipiens]
MATEDDPPLTGLVPQDESRGAANVTSVLDTQPPRYRTTLLQKAGWPSGKGPAAADAQMNADLATLGCCFVIINRHVPVEEIAKIEQSIKDPAAITVWKFVIESRCPSKPDHAITELTAAAAMSKILSEHRGGSGFAAFARLGVFQALWDLEVLHPDRVYSKTQSHDWRLAEELNGTTRKERFQRPDFEWDGQGDLQAKYQDYTCLLHRKEKERELALKWRVPDVLRMSYQSDKEMPDIFSRIHTIELPGQSTPNGQSTAPGSHQYRLLGVVRTAKPDDEPMRDLVRIYDPYKQQMVIPFQPSETVFFPADWTLAEPNRRFLLYYARIPDPGPPIPAFTPTEIR